MKAGQRSCVSLWQVGSWGEYARNVSIRLNVHGYTSLTDYS